jgi:hypothetical protein
VHVGPLNCLHEVQNVQKVQNIHGARDATAAADSEQASAIADAEAKDPGTSPPKGGTAPVQAPKQPNVHLQRLAAISDFFTGRRQASERRPRPGEAQQSAPSCHTAALQSEAELPPKGSVDFAVLQNFVQDRVAMSEPALREKPQTLPEEPLSVLRSEGSEIAGPPVLLPAGGVAVDELFENERRQPFRGWGHTWPGHFLPTDPVGHWCSRSGRSAGAGSSFEDNEPPVPEGWVAYATCLLPACTRAYLYWRWLTSIVHGTSVIAIACSTCLGCVWRS